MSEQRRRVSVVYYPQFFPCGPSSACCGPVGQSQEEVNRYVQRLQQELPDAEVRLVDATQPDELASEPAAARLLNSFGAAGCPLFVVNGQVVAMGPPQMDELVAMLKEQAPR